MNKKIITVDKQLNLTILNSEYQNSNIFNEFYGLSTEDNKLLVYYSGEADESLIQGIYDAHIYTETPVFKLTNSNNSPIEIDYNLFGLHKKRTIVKGELILVQYYKNFNPQTKEYSDLVVSEERIFGRDEVSGLAYNRTQISKWYLTDGTVGETKTSTKWYTPTESIDEGIIRRQNIIAEAKIFTLGCIGLVPAQTLLLSLAAEVALYVDGAPMFLINKISTLENTGLTAEQKTQLIEILTM